MSKIFKIFMMLLVVAACSEKEKDNREELSIVNAEGNAITYKVELAQTKEQLSTGLMNRETLAADAGMIFDLSAFKGVPTVMWMKDTKIPLDMLFIDQDGMIFWIYENAEPESLKIIVAPYSATAVLEINGGDVAAKGIQIGDTVKYKLFEPKNTQENADQAQAKDETPTSESTSEVEEEAVIEEVVAVKEENGKEESKAE